MSRQGRGAGRMLADMWMKPECKQRGTGAHLLDEFISISMKKLRFVDKNNIISDWYDNNTDTLFVDKLFTSPIKIQDNGEFGDMFGRQIEPVAAYVPYMTVVGNHESAQNFSHYINRYTMPNSEHNLFYRFFSSNIAFAFEIILLLEGWCAEKFQTACWCGLL